MLLARLFHDQTVFEDGLLQVLEGFNLIIKHSFHEEWGNIANRAVDRAKPQQAHQDGEPKSWKWEHPGINGYEEWG